MYKKPKKEQDTFLQKVHAEKRFFLTIYTHTPHRSKYFEVFVPVSTPWNKQNITFANRCRGK